MNGGSESNIANTFLSSDPKRGQLRLLLPSWPVRRARIQQLGDELRAGRALNETNEDEDGGDSESGRAWCLRLATSEIVHFRWLLLRRKLMKARTEQRAIVSPIQGTT